MGWVVLVVIAYLPIVYKIHKRLNDLEDEVKRLKRDHIHHS